MTQAAMRLQSAYACLAQGAWDPVVFGDAVRQFALLLVALEAATPSPFWRVKPELHPMLELART